MAQHPQVHRRVGPPQLPDHEGRQGHQRQHGQLADQRGGEPVELSPLLQHHLNARQAHHQQGDAHPVDPWPWPIAIGMLLGGKCGEGQQGGQQTEGQVDEEHPAPAQAIGEHAAQGGPQGRPHQHHQPEHPLGHALQAAGHRPEQNRLGHRHQPAPQSPLQQPCAHQQRQCRGEAAQQGSSGEAQQRDQKIATLPQPGGEPAAERDHHDAGHRVTGHHPAHLGQGGAQAGLNVQQRDVGDAHVDHLEHRPGRSGEDDQPLADGEPFLHRGCT